MPTTKPDVLDREMYSEAEAARLLNVPPSTLHYWLEGKSRTYRPIIRSEPRGGHPAVTWAEFVEAGLLREYRRTHHVPMAELRTFIDALRDSLGVPYPLAHHRPYTSGKNLLWQAQEQAGLDPDFCLVAVAGDQYLLTGPSASFLRRVTWEGDVASAWKPAEPESPVVMDPEVRFGLPSIKGISTGAIWEHSQAGEDEVEIAKIFDLTVPDVRWALAYELPRRAA